jgi:hypothetical protein
MSEARMKLSTIGSISFAALAAAVFCVLPTRAIAQASPPAAPGTKAAEQKELMAKPTPRLPDHHPDLNGIWYQPLFFLGAGEKQGNTLRYVLKPDPTFLEAVKGPPPEYRPSYKPELLAKVAENDKEQVKRDPAFYCRPPGVPRIGPPQKIVQTASEVIFLYSDTSGNFWRIIPTDGRPHRTDAESSYLGDSVGRWDGDTLAVDANNFNDDSWLADNGWFHSEALHVVERLTRKGDTIKYEVTVEDPKVLTKPWTMQPRVLTLIKEPLDEAPPCVEKDSANMMGLEHHGNPR